MKIDSTESKLCCRVNPEIYCKRCGLALCSDCRDLRKKKKDVIAQGLGRSWTELLPGNTPCTKHGKSIVTGYVFDGHFF